VIERTAEHPPPDDHGVDDAAKHPERRARRHRTEARRRDVVGLVLGTVVVPPLLYLVLQPDWYFRQNGLDPWFYTGYAQNLPNALAMVGSKHYFVSRWSLYLPSRLFFELFGAVPGFVIMRWAITAIAMAVILLFGRRRWGWAGAYLGAFAMVLSPMFVRAAFSDYSDAVVLPAGLAVIGILACRNEHIGWGVVAGATAALAVVANAFAISMVAISLGTVLVVARFERRWMGRLRLAAAFGVGFVVVIVGGLLVFRWHYHIANVYQPTIDFIWNKRNDVDPLRRSTLAWMGYFLWIYFPPLVLVISAWLWLRNRVAFSRAEATVLAVCAVQYLFQVWYQFAEHGTTLEISYYWTYVLPALFLASATLIGRSAQRAGPRAAAATGFVAVVILSLVDHMPELLPSWPVALVVIGTVVIGACGVFRRFPQVLMVVAFAMPVLVPLAAPRPVPTAPGDSTLTPQYDTAFHASTSVGQQCFHAASWFVDEMKSIGLSREREMYFWPTTTGCGQPMVATSLAHPAGRNLAPPGVPVAEQNWARMGDAIQMVTLVGDPASVRSMEQQLDAHEVTWKTLLHSARNGMEIRVVQLSRPT
jgi:hypothetical protein